jgi:hypothetical protein
MTTTHEKKKSGEMERKSLSIKPARNSTPLKEGLNILLLNHSFFPVDIMHACMRAASQSPGTLFLGVGLTGV